MGRTIENIFASNDDVYNGNPIIRRYFFEGRGIPYRVDPERVVRYLGLNI